ncbi:bifunctional alpha/beta hydrolase/class I SAM-dependent methyltransferase [Acinetobacter sp. S40]|uniref:bifunctional alpha/beta hydrolase/class I SAM-dependent methyltransferase n=1 Tax=unclassified Acinetobacter TaxID=196816 RepID=UPI001909FDC8|nr:MULTISPECIES: bifunctional alpha/beta hydrolase/class I SAM-dependent methyltransferase [unclassified Acinetobacter]MBJ9986682.1 bifunctional alpha/beta hydrolase/class I SAM-dependent methyltransferase [Acinetobacter sp. S40]MBK0063202.1 bifunctional alpha/beta hydrolase/class I SAM-dependent methyltransferase [Acinetobacter sp. S55]MBK0066886.1 bifunctional alpha/beta hydrolase/class I SAM-dependent methyltransferase [Acinetobacter sp. S54]
MHNNTQHQFVSHDGTSLFYQRWASLQNPDHKAIVLFHRGHEHSQRMAHLVVELKLPDFDFFAWDARGHGQSPGERGDAPSFSACVKDIQYFIQHITDQYKIQPQNMVVIGQSVGAVLAATWVHDYAPNLRALCLASPAFDIKLYVPFAKPGLTLLSKLRGNFFITSYVKAKMLTHDSQRAKEYESDPQIAKAISVRMLLGLYNTSKRIVEDAQNIFIPTQILCSGSDFVVEQKPQRLFYERLPHPQKEFHILEGFYHDTLGEKDREIAFQKIRRFIQQSFVQNPEKIDVLHADKIGPSCATAEQLSSPLPPNSLKNWFWSITKKNLKIGSHLSQGLKIGEETGYDSGSTLDFVYRNAPESRNILGKIIDQQYLNAIGWRGIRVRKQHLEQLLSKYAEKLIQAQKPLKILDIAAGHGRYILDAVSQFSQRPDSILLRDYSELNVESGAELIKQRNLQDIAQFKLGDAFDENSLASIEPKVNLAVVSGLYELFSDNDLIRRSLAGLSHAIEQEGYIIYTGQIWHPQQEFIARALTSHRQGEAWVMRLRSQAEMDALVEQAGFKKIDQSIDEYGIFTVSVAQKL